MRAEGNGALGLVRQQLGGEFQGRRQGGCWSVSKAATGLLISLEDVGCVVELVCEDCLG